MPSESTLIDAPPQKGIIILRDILPALCDAADFWVQSDAQHAVEARLLLNQTAGGVADSFHPTIAGCLQSLRTISAGWTALTYHSPGAQDEAHKLLAAILQIANEGLDKSRLDCLCTLERLHKGIGISHAIFKCPKLLLRRNLEKQLEICTDVFLDDQLSAGWFDQFRPMQEWAKARQFCENLEHLYDILVDRFGCDCPQQHSIRASFSSRKPSRTRFCLYFQHDDFQSSVADMRLSSRDLQKYSDSKAKHARFEASDSAAALDPDSIASLCQMLLQGDNTLSLFTEGSAHQVHLEETKTSTAGMGLGMPQMLSSSTAFDCTELPQTGIADRLKIAALVAYVYLNLSGSNCLPDDATELGVWFMIQKDESGGMPWQPFLLLGMPQPDQEAPSSEGSMARYICRQRPSLPALGKLLLEVGLQKTLNWDLVDAKKEVSVLMSEAYLSIIETCLAPPSEIAKPGRFDKEARRVFLERIAKGLQYLLRQHRVTRLEQIFGLGRPAEKGKKPSTMDSVPDAAIPQLHLHNWTDKAGVETRDDGVEKSREKPGKDFRTWMGKFDSEVAPLYNASPNCGPRPVKVAIIDTGANITNRTARMTQGGIQEYYSWCEVDGISEGHKMLHNPSHASAGTGSETLETASDNDPGHHGTSLLSLLMRIAPNSQIYVAKVFDSRCGMAEKMPDDLTAQRVADAIMHAANTWDVDIISMSFGFPAEVEIIEEALERVAERKILIASAHNEGYNEPVRWPANRNSVICMHAAHGKGRIYTNNPIPSDESKRLATLGCDIDVWTPNNNHVLRSGTSYATIVAAGIAARVIELMEQQTDKYIEWKLSADARPDQRKRITEHKAYNRKLKRIRKYQGMMEVLSSMTFTEKFRQDYVYVTPWSLLYENALESVHRICSCFKSL